MSSILALLLLLLLSLCLPYFLIVIRGISIKNGQGKIIISWIIFLLLGIAAIPFGIYEYTCSADALEKAGYLGEGISRFEQFIDADGKLTGLIYGHSISYYKNMGTLGLVLIVAGIIILIAVFVESCILISNNTKHTVEKMRQEMPNGALNQ